MERRATVITDASYCHRTKAAGWAAWIRTDGQPPIKRYGTFKDTPSGPAQAELWASYNGLYFAHAVGATTVLLQTDCMAVVDKFNGNMSALAGSLKAKPYAELKAKGINLQIKAKHVKGHTKTQDARSYCNRWCDEWAKKQMRKQRRSIDRDTGPTS